MASYPDLVYLDRVNSSSDGGHGSKMDKLRRTRAYQPVLSDIRAIAPTGWYGKPEKATIDKGQKMVADLASAISERSSEIFDLLDEVNGGLATLDRLEKGS
jgi:creatinine amidohydrolase